MYFATLFKLALLCCWSSAVPVSKGSNKPIHVDNPIITNGQNHIGNLFAIKDIDLSYLVLSRSPEKIDIQVDLRLLESKHRHKCQKHKKVDTSNTTIPEDNPTVSFSFSVDITGEENTPSKSLPQDASKTPPLSTPCTELVKSSPNSPTPTPTSPSQLSASPTPSSQDTTPAPQSTNPATDTLDFSATSAYAIAIVTLHNTLRQNHGASPLTWDEKLARDALKTSQTCVLRHPDGIGSNLAWGYPDATAAVNGWYDEIKHESISSIIQSEDWQVTGHATQLLWNSTTRLGCATYNCTENGPFLTCLYDPEGNEGGINEATGKSFYAENVFPLVNGDPGH